jgi:hypothetical protein
LKSVVLDIKRIDIKKESNQGARGLKLDIEVLGVGINVRVI